MVEGVVVREQGVSLGVSLCGAALQLGDDVGEKEVVVGDGGLHQGEVYVDGGTEGFVTQGVEHGAGFEGEVAAVQGFYKYGGDVEEVVQDLLEELTRVAQVGDIFY